eukprot:UN00192
MTCLTLLVIFSGEGTRKFLAQTALLLSSSLQFSRS